MSEAPAATVVAVLDEFDKAFGEAAVLDEKKPVVEDTSAADAQALKDADAAKAAAATTPPAGETAEQKTAREAAEKTATDAAAAAALAAETPEQKTARETAEAQAVKDTKAAADAKLLTDAAAATLAEDARRRKATDDAAAQALADAKKKTDDAAALVEAAALAPYEFSEDEKKFLEKFKTDFPGEYAGMEARMKQMGQSTKAQIHAAVKEVEQRMNAALVPLAAQTEEQARAAHTTAIYTAHADFNDVVVKLPEWIKTQPAYLQPTMQAVYDKGDTQSVIALVSDYKKAAGIVVAPAAGVTAATGKTAAQIATETAAATAAAAAKAQAAVDAAGLLPVSSKSTIPAAQGGTDKNDFDAAFAEASDALSVKK